MGARIRAIYTAARESEPMQSVGQVEIRAGHGIVGDKSAGTKDREVTVFRREDFVDALRDAGLEGRAVDGSTRRNLEIEGLSATELRGPILHVGEAVFRVMDECHPCKLMERYVGPGAKAALEGRAGVCCVVERGGIVRPGDPVSCSASAPT